MSETKEVAVQGSPPSKTDIAISRGTGLKIQNISELGRLATAMVKAGIAPKGMTDMGALGVMAFGMELGLSPIQSLKDICFINGRASAYGDAIVALLIQSGLLVDTPKVEYAGKGLLRSCTVTLVRKGWKTPIVKSFSMEDAKLGKLTEKGGPWLTYPDRMLYWRALNWCAREGFGDVLKGLHIREVVEDAPEVVDLGPQEARTKPEPALDQVKEIPLGNAVSAGPQEETAAETGTPEECAALWRAWVELRKRLTPQQLAFIYNELGIADLSEKDHVAALDCAITRAEELLKGGANA